MEDAFDAVVATSAFLLVIMVALNQVVSYYDHPTAESESPAEVVSLGLVSKLGSNATAWKEFSKVEPSVAVLNGSDYLVYATGKLPLGSGQPPGLYLQLSDYGANPLTWSAVLGLNFSKPSQCETSYEWLSDGSLLIIEVCAT